MIFLKSQLRRLRRDSAPDATFKAALRSRLLAIDNAHTSPAMGKLGGVVAFRYAFAALALMLVAGFGTTTYAYASPSVAEGDTLYPVKTRLENMEARLHDSPEARMRFEQRLKDRRFSELQHKLHHREPLSPEQQLRYHELFEARMEMMQR